MKEIILVITELIRVNHECGGVMLVHDGRDGHIMILYGILDIKNKSGMVHRIKCLCTTVASLQEDSEFVP